jgi:hypothetical protein
MPAGTVVTGAVCGAALVQPALAKAAGAVLTAGTPPAAQLGGTDNPPIEDAWPTLANTGAPPKLAESAGPRAADSGPALKASVKPRAAVEGPEPDGTNWPWPNAVKADAAVPTL